MRALFHSRSSALWSIWFAALVFIYPIPHTIALRNLLLLAGLIVSIVVLWRHRSGRPAFRSYLSEWKIELSLFAGLNVWMLFQIFWFAMYPSQAFDLWCGDWLVMQIAFCIGVLAVRASNSREVTLDRCGSLLLTAAASALFFHIVWLLGYQISLAPTLGVNALGLTPFAQRDFQSTLCMTLIALLFGDLLLRLTTGRAVLLFSRSEFWLILLVAFIATITLKTRNGTLVTIGLCVLAALFFFKLRIESLRNLKLRLLAVILGGVILISLFSWAAIKSDERWQRFSETVKVSRDIHANLYWLNSSLGHLPITSDGQYMEESAYYRIAWGTAAIEQIEAHPFGVGYGHKAFGWAVNDAYGVNTGHQSSHSGILDFTLANGLPGLILWLLFTAALIRRGWRNFSLHRSPVGILLVFHVIAYFSRIVLDGHFSGFRLEMFALLLGVLIAHSVTDNAVVKAA